MLLAERLPERLLVLLGWRLEAGARLLEAGAGLLLDTSARMRLKAAKVLRRRRLHKGLRLPARVLKHG